MACDTGRYSRMDVHLSSPRQTACLARALADILRPGDCVALEGEMGAGKSTLARAVIRALAGDGTLDVPSPTFALLQPYDTQAGPVFHYDLWRLSGPDELSELAWDDACEGIMLVEWPDRAEDMLPVQALHLLLQPGDGEEGRILAMTGWPEARLAGLLAAFRAEAGKEQG